MRRNIPTKVHGYLDYAGALLLWFAPTLFNFEHVGGPAVLIPRILAVVMLLQSLATDYELGVAKVIPMSMHLMMDYALSFFLAVSPFLFHFNTFDARVWAPHLAVGVAYLIASLMTQKEPSEYYRSHHSHAPAHR